MILAASRETAFVHSAQSGGVTLAIARTCSRGGAPGWCGCDNTWTKQPTVNFTWGSCSDNYVKGYLFGKQFMDAKEDGQSASSLATLHNYEAGRLAVHNTMKLQCKCHGLTGTCAHKTCWYSLPVIQVVGKVLLSRYTRAAQVNHDTNQQTLVPSTSVYRLPMPEDLVYVRQSPDYCLPDVSVGSLGTSGRQCHRESVGPAGCDDLCCGRGFNVQRRIETKNCACKFIWCCRVECKKCRTVTETQTCL